MKIYIAARYSRRKEMKIIAGLLTGFGFTVTSRWLDESLPETITLPETSPTDCLTFAKIDLEDINSSDILLFFSEDPLVGTPRGGRHVEFGYALATGKRIAVIGGVENIFHYLTGIVHYPDLQTFLEAEAKND